MTQYVEIEDVREIARHNRAMAKNLAAALRHKERREIGYPQGKFDAVVRFLADTGKDVLWWSGGLSESGEKHLNFFGRGTPGDKSVLNIDVQFSLPAGRFSRTLGGAFVKGISTNQVLLAHHGIVTLGHGRVKKDALFAEMAEAVRDVQIERGTAALLLVGDLGSATFVQDIASFSEELRRTVKQMKADLPRKSKRAAAKTKARPRPQATPLGKLKDYFDEFSGKKQIRAKRATVADCYHGSVVRALRDHFGDTNQVLKTREIDLVALTGRKALVFEVKTSANTQNIYTAIGQLLVHSPVVARHAPRRHLERIIVVPENPVDHLSRALTEHLGIHIVTFVRSKAGRVTFSGLVQLS